MTYEHFIADGTTHVVAPVDPRTHDTELRAFVAHREAAREDRFKRNVATLLPSCTYARWSHVVSVTHEHTLTIGRWRATRSHDAILETLRRCTNDVHTLTRRTSGTLVTADGTLTLDTRDEARAAHNAHAALIAARRTARRYRRTTLRNAYWGTLTVDGMSLNGRNVKMRFAPLDRALAFSDTLVTRDGIETVMFARNTVRHDDGSVSPLDTHNAAILRQRHGKR